MTKEELNQFNDLKAEIKELEFKIQTLSQKKTGATYDKVKASYKDFPYIQCSASVYGFDSKSEDARKEAIDKKMKILADRKRKAEKEEQKIAAFINSVESSRIRRIMEYRYIDGYKWEKIAQIIHCDRTAPEKMITKYLKEKND